MIKQIKDNVKSSLKRILQNVKLITIFKGLPFLFGGLISSFILFNSCNQMSKCEDNPSANEGINIDYYNNGFPNRVYELKNCRLNGITVYFFPNGEISSYGYAKMGKREGYWTVFDSSLTLRCKQLYKQGNFVSLSSYDYSITMDSAFILRYQDKEVNLSTISAIRNSHPSDFFIKRVQHEIVIDVDKESVVLDTNLNIVLKKHEKQQ